MTILAESTERIPTWALSCLINKDSSGLNDEDMQLINDWRDELTNEAITMSGWWEIAPPNEGAEPYFSWQPAFGLPCNVIDCKTCIFGD